MKKNILALSLLAAVVAGFTACSDDNLSSESVIKPSKTANTVFDKWLYKNFVVPYNIQIQWRYEDNESDMSYYDVPADSAQSVGLAHIVKYTCVEAYTEAAGIGFTRRFFPKLFSFLGEFEYENNGNIKLGTAEGGRRFVSWVLTTLIDSRTTAPTWMNTTSRRFTTSLFTSLTRQRTTHVSLVR